VLPDPAGLRLSQLHHPLSHGLARLGRALVRLLLRLLQLHDVRGPEHKLTILDSRTGRSRKGQASSVQRSRP
jgi:hypothetical protein